MKQFARGLLLTMITSITAPGAFAAASLVSKAGFGTTADGKAVDIYTLKSATVEAKIMTYGARIVSIQTPDKGGKMADVVLGHTDLAGYVGDGKTYFGAVVGRYGNRISKGQFSIDGQSHQIPTNDHGNALHGGKIGFDSQVWTGKEIPDGVEMTLVSPDGDQGFPGKLTAHVKYTLHGDALHIDYSATTDKATVTNLTNHSYFNLNGEGSGSILEETLQINASKYTPTDSGLIPTGIEPVAGTPFDFQKPTVIGERIHADNVQLTQANGGYDLNWVLNGPAGQMKVAAVVHDPKSGRILTVSTTQPGVQFYTGNFLDGTVKGPSGNAYDKYSALCLETQHFPDSPNHPAFPTTELKPGQTLHTETIFAFTTEKK